jgi:spore germination protein
MMQAQRIFKRILIMSICFIVPLSSQQELDFHFAYRPAAFEVLKEYVDYVTIVLPEPFIVDASGVVYGEIEPRLLKLATENNLKIMPQIKNPDPAIGTFNQEWARSILNNEKIRDRVIQSMVQLCKQYDLYGIQVDLENVHIDDRDALTEFYRLAADALHREGYKISIAVVHRAEESAGPNTYTKWMMENWRGAYDLKALGEIGDFIKIMSYAQHTRRTTPGPSQGLPWLTEVLKYALQYVPPEKLSLGLTMRGSHYYTVADTALYYVNARSWSRSITRKEAESLIEQYNGRVLQWDDRQNMLYGYIERGGLLEWFILDEDIRSFDAKLELVREYNIKAVNMWIFGNEEHTMWERIKKFRYNN